MATKRKSSVAKAKKVVKKKHVDSLARWALEPGFKMNLKRCDQTISVNITNSPTTAASLLSTIAQNVGDNSRVGQRVRFFNWHVRGNIEYVPAATSVAQADYHRVIFFYDRQTNGVAPQWNQVIGNIAAGTASAFDPPNWYTRGRFKILRDFKVNTGPQSATVAGGLITTLINGNAPPYTTSKEMMIDFFVALKGKIDCEWTGTGSTIGNITGGGLFMTCQNVDGTGQYILTFTSSIEFMDV